VIEVEYGGHQEIHHLSHGWSNSISQYLVANQKTIYRGVKNWCIAIDNVPQHGIRNFVTTFVSNIAPVWYN
jgi:hypothetical protein